MSYRGLVRQAKLMVVGALFCSASAGSEVRWYFCLRHERSRGHRSEGSYLTFPCLASSNVS